MLNFSRKSLLCGAIAVLGVSTMSAAFNPAAAADRLIRRCSATAAGDISMAARYELRNARKKFTVEMEAATPGAFRAGQRITFVVAGRTVGTDTLTPVVGGDLIGELNLDTQARPGDDEKPFPTNFPPIGVGTSVQIKAGAKLILGCALR